MSKASRRKKPPAPKGRSLKSRLIWFGIKAGIVVAILWTIVALFYYAWASFYDLKQISEMPQRSTVYDHDGKYYSRLAGENRIIVPFDKVSNYFVNALLAREDSRYYFHHGIDPIGILRAIARNFIGGGFRQGASTITQQLARNSFPLGGKNINRKLLEAAMAYRIETELTKEQILEAYMNRIYFGSGFYGIEAASQAYFGKPASRLNLSEAATLAGLIRSPNRYSPFNNPEGAVRERNTVLGRMEQMKFITEEEMETAKKASLQVATRVPASPQENWAMDAILRDLELVISREQFDEGGLKIYTTIDGTLQRIAETSVKRRLAEIEASPGYPHPAYAVARAKDAPYLQAAAIALDNRDGGIRAIVGGRDYEQSKFNRALLGQRQVGSAVKPFVYAKAFSMGLRPNDPISDARIGPSDLPSKYGRYNPSNSDGTYGANLPAADGLILSRNTMSVRIGKIAGFDAIADCVQLAGLTEKAPRFPSICLGAFEANLKNLTASYTVFATGGMKLQPYLVERIVDADGQTIYKATHGKFAVLPADAARLTRSVMEEILNRGTAAGARRLGLRHRAAGKTGTTNEYQDAWFVGFDDKVTCGVWVGFDLPEKIMSGGTGAALALPIWVDIVEP